jgi:hypothetical protein
LELKQIQKITFPVETTIPLVTIGTVDILNQKKLDKNREFSVLVIGNPLSASSATDFD